MDFKFFEQRKTTAIINLNDYWETTTSFALGDTSPSRVINIQPQRFQNTEFCFQFGDNEPIVFANTLGSSCTIQLNPTSDANMIFNDGNGNVFKLFARETQNGNQRV